MEWFERLERDYKDLNKVKTIDSLRKKEPKRYKATLVEIGVDSIKKLLPSNVDVIKAKLLRMAKQGKKRPHIKSYLGIRLSNFLCQRNSFFKQKIVFFAPEWFAHRWDEKKLTDVAKKYKTRVEFKNGNSGAYAKACKLGILEKITAHMANKIKSDKELMDLAKKFKFLRDFQKKYPSYYCTALRRKLDLSFLKKINRTWSNKEIKKYALKYKRPVDWQNNHPASYSVAIKRGLLKKMCKHMSVRLKSSTKNECLLEARKFNTIQEWAKLGKLRMSAFNKGKNFYKKCTSHMVLPISKKRRPIVNLDTNETFSHASEVILKYPNCSKVRSACQGHRKTVGGYRWAYVDENGKVIKNTKPKKKQK